MKASELYFRFAGCTMSLRKRIRKQFVTERIRKRDAPPAAEGSGKGKAPYEERSRDSYNP